MVYLLAIVACATMFASFGVDYGRVQLARTQLQNVADAAARAAALGLLTSPAQARADGISAASMNFCDASPVGLPAMTSKSAIWDTASRRFRLAPAL